MSNNVRCSRCGRRLKNPASIEAGIGPVCKIKENLERARLNAEHQERLEKVGILNLDPVSIGEDLAAKFTDQK
jgi:hypothetical protein